MGRGQWGPRSGEDNLRASGSAAREEDAERRWGQPFRRLPTKQAETALRTQQARLAPSPTLSRELTKPVFRRPSAPGGPTSLPRRGGTSVLPRAPSHHAPTPDMGDQRLSFKAGPGRSPEHGVRAATRPLGHVAQKLPKVGARQNQVVSLNPCRITSPSHPCIYDAVTGRGPST